MVTWLVWGWIESVRLDRTLEALEARHEPLDLGEFAVKPTTDAQKEASHPTPLPASLSENARSRPRKRLGYP